MPGPGALLREIHRWRRHAKELQTKIDQGPRLLKAQQDQLARQEENFRQAQDTIKQLKVKTHELEVSSKATQQLLKKYQKQLEEAAGAKEYTTLRLEIDQANQEILRLNEAILETMVATEEGTARLPEADQAVRKARADFAQFDKDLQARLAGWGEQRQRALLQLADLEPTLPEEVQAYYQRLVAAKGDDALASVNGRICEACYTEITAQMSNDLLRALFVLCKSCGRILYLPAEE